MVTYPGFGLGPIDPVGGAARALAEVIPNGTIATERGALVAALASGLSTVEVGAELAQARAVKDEDEIALLRTALALCDAGQRAAREHAQPGMTELDGLGRSCVPRSSARRVSDSRARGPRRRPAHR